MRHQIYIRGVLFLHQVLCPFICEAFRELLNKFIHSSGDNPLLAQALTLLQEEPAQANNLTCLIPVAVGIILKLLVSFVALSNLLPFPGTKGNKIRYVLGHVIMSILILETAETQTDSHEMGGEKRIPSCRRLIQTLSSLYSKGGIHILLSGFGAGCDYWVAHSSWLFRS